MSPHQTAQDLIMTLEKGLQSGVKHYKKSTDKQLMTVKEILEAMVDDGEIKVIFPKGMTNEQPT